MTSYLQTIVFMPAEVMLPNVLTIRVFRMEHQNFSAVKVSFTGADK